MPKPPFRLTGPASEAGILRAPDGRFTRGTQLQPPQVVRKSSDEGITIDKVIAANRAPEHARPRGAPPSEANEIPWPETGSSFNDARRPSFRLT
jgi:hypothetical protein